MEDHGRKGTAEPGAQDPKKIRQKKGVRLHRPDGDFQLIHTKQRNARMPLRTPNLRLPLAPGK